MGVNNMDWDKEFGVESEKPLDKLVDGISNTAIFRSIAFIGDSLSSGEFETVDSDGKRHYYDMYEYSWGQYIARKNGLKAYNFSRGGMTAKEYLEDFADKEGFWDKEKACQAYVIALGANDLNGVMPGDIEDIDVNDYHNNKPTFMGYYGAIVSRYKEIQPDAKFFFVTFPRTSYNDEAQINMTESHVKAMYDLSSIFENTYVIDLYKYGPTYDEEFKNKFYLHGHLNASGYILTARIIDSYIDYIVRHNPEDFQNVPFIGTEIQYK